MSDSISEATSSENSTTGIVNVKKTVSVDWEITNFSRYTKAGIRLQSPEFSSGYGNWSIIFWPNGNTKEDCYVRLALLCSNAISASYELNIKGSELNIKGSEPNIRRKSSSYGYSYNQEYNPDGSLVKATFTGTRQFDGKSFVSHTIGRKGWLVKNKTRYFPNNILSISCQLTIVEEHQENMGDISSQMLEDMAWLLANNDFSDVNITVKKKIIPAHTCILAARSPVFKNMFSSDRKKTVVQINKFDPDVVLEMLKYIYTGNYPNPELAGNLVALAEMYGLSELIKVCEKTLIGNLSTENFCSTIVISNLHKMENLKTACLDFGVINMNDIIKTKGFDDILHKEPKLVKDIFEEYVYANQ